jgi:hypothetical protein
VKLWHGEITYRVVLVADDQAGAEKVLREEMHVIRANEAAELDVYELKHRRMVPPEWRSSMPYGASEDRTVGEIADGLFTVAPPTPPARD